MNVDILSKVKGTHITLGSLVVVLAAMYSGFQTIRPQIVLAEDLEQVEQTWSQAIKANTDALVAMQKMDIKSDLREIARELAKLDIAHEEGEWDEDMAMYEAELLEEQLALRAALDDLGGSK